MELRHDWNAFQEMFYARKRVRSGSETHTTPVYIVVDQGIVATASAEGEDFSGWTGLSLKEASESSEFLAKNRELVLFERKDVDRWIQDSVAIPGFYNQLEAIRHSAKHEFNAHFLLKGMESWWNKVLPSSYGVYISVETQPKKHLLVVVRRGKFEGFQEPDLGGLDLDRRRQPVEVIKHLADKFSVPVQGIYVSAGEWAEWSQMQSPWRKIAQSVKADRTQLVPFRWGVASLMAMRAFFGI